MLLNADEILDFAIEKIKNFSSISEKEVIQIVHNICDKNSLTYPIDENWWERLFSVIEKNRISISRNGKLKESIFSKKLHSFLSYPWKNEIEKRIVKSLYFDNKKISSEGEQGKEYIKSFIKNNKNTLENNCSENFVAELNNLTSYLSETVVFENHHNKMISKALIRLQKIIELQSQYNWNMQMLKISLKDFKENYNRSINNKQFWSSINDIILGEDDLKTSMSKIKLSMETLKEIEQDSSLDENKNVIMNKELNKLLNETLSSGVFLPQKISKWKDDPLDESESPDDDQFDIWGRNTEPPKDKFIESERADDDSFDIWGRNTEPLKEEDLSDEDIASNVTGDWNDIGDNDKYSRDKTSSENWDDIGDTEKIRTVLTELTEEDDDENYSIGEAMRTDDRAESKSKKKKLKEEKQASVMPKIQGKFKDGKNAPDFNDYITPAKGGVTKPQPKEKQAEGQIVFQNLQLWKNYIQSKFEKLKFEDQLHFEDEVGDVIAYSNDDIVGKFCNGYAIVKYTDFDVVGEYPERKVEEFYDDKSDNLKESRLILRESENEEIENSLLKIGFKYVKELADRSITMVRDEKNGHTYAHISPDGKEINGIPSEEFISDFSKKKIKESETSKKKPFVITWDYKKGGSNSWIKKEVSFSTKDSAEWFAKKIKEVATTAIKNLKITNSDSLNESPGKITVSWDNKDEGTGDRWSKKNTWFKSKKVADDFVKYLKAKNISVKNVRIEDTLTEDMTTGDMAVADAPIGVIKRTPDPILKEFSSRVQEFNPNYFNRHSKGNIDNISINVSLLKPNTVVSFIPMIGNKQAGKEQEIRCSNVEQIKKCLLTFKEQYPKADYIKATIIGKEVGRVLINESKKIKEAQDIPEFEINDIIIDNGQDEIVFEYSYDNKEEKFIDASLDSFKTFIEKEDPDYSNYEFEDRAETEEGTVWFKNNNFEIYWNDLNTDKKNDLAKRFLVNKMGVSIHLTPKKFKNIDLGKSFDKFKGIK